MPTPTLKTPELVDEILSRIATGEPLAVILREDGKPHQTNWNEWVRADDALAIACAHAREVGFDAIANRALEIADTVTDDPQCRKVRIETRLKLLAKWDPKRYGDKLDVAHSGSVAFNATPSDQGVL